MRYVRVLIYEARRVVYLVVDHHVQILLRCVLADIGVRELLRLGHGRQRRRGARVCLCGGRVPVCCGIGMCRQREEEEEEEGIAEGGSAGVNWKFRDGETRVYGGSGERMLFVHL